MAQRHVADQLGNPRNAPEAAALGRTVQTGRPESFAANVLPVVRSIQSVSISAMTAGTVALNDRGIRTARGGATTWIAISVAKGPSGSGQTAVAWL